MERIFSVIKLWICVLFLTAAASPVMAAEKPEEEAIRVGYFQMEGFNGYDDTGKPFGYQVEYLDKIAEKTDWEYSYVPAANWQEAVTLLEEGKIDLLAPAQKTKEREERFGFSAYAIGREFGSLIALKTREDLIYEDYEHFSDITIGCVEDIIFRDDLDVYARQNGFSTNLVFYEDTTAVIRALRSGEIDAALVNIMAVPADAKLLAKFGYASFYFMMNREAHALRDKLDAALMALRVEQPNLENEITQRYFPIYVEESYSKAELEFIAGCRTLRVGVPSYFEPMSYVDKTTGELTGVTVKILDEISKDSGLQFEYVGLPTGPITYEYLLNHHIDLVSNVEYNGVNTKIKDINMTIPYFHSSKAFVCRKEDGFDKSQPLKVAMATGSQTIERVVRQLYPEFEIIHYDTIEESMDSVLHGDTDAMIQNKYVAERLLERAKYEKLQEVPLEGVNDIHCMSVVIPPDVDTADVLADSRLVSSLDKAIGNLDIEKITKAVLDETVNSGHPFALSDFFYRYGYAVAAVSLGVIIVIGMLIYISGLRRAQYRNAQQNEKKFRNIAESIHGAVLVLLPDKDYRVSYVNGGFREITGVPLEEGSTGLREEYKRWIHPDDADRLQKAMHEMKQDSQISFPVRVWCEEKYVPLLLNATMTTNEKGEKEFCAVLVDISEQVGMMEQMEKEQEVLLKRVQQDSLTGLYNKVTFEAKCKEYLAREDYENVAMIFFDLDNFKQINDVLGHMTGDRALRETGQKLRKIFSHCDILSRFGGDEFCVLAKDIPRERLEDKLAFGLKKLEKVYTDGRHEVLAAVSIGVAYSETKPNSFEQLLSQADKALYIAKKQGKNCCVFYKE